MPKRGGQPKTTQRPDRTAHEEVRKLAGYGLSRKQLADFMQVPESRFVTGDLSTPYLLGRGETRNRLLAEAHERAFDRNYKLSDYNLWKLLEMAYGVNEAEQADQQVTMPPPLRVVTQSDGAKAAAG